MSEAFSLLGFQWRHQIISPLRAIALVTFVFPVLFWQVLWMWVFRGIDPNISHELISTLKRLNLFSAFMFAQSIHAQIDLYHRENHAQWFQRVLSVLGNNSIHTPEPGTRKRDGNGNAHDERAHGEMWETEGIHNDVTSVVLTTRSCTTLNLHHDLELWSHNQQQRKINIYLKSLTIITIIMWGMCAHTAGTLVSPYKFMVQIYYRPQGKGMFSEACIILSTGGALLMERDPRLDRDSPGQQQPPCQRPQWAERPLEGTWDQTGSDIIHPPFLTSSGRHCSGQYASYWNAFWFLFKITL